MGWGRVALLVSIACLAASEVAVEATVAPPPRPHQKAGFAVAVIPPPPRVFIVTPEPASFRGFNDVLSDVLAGRE